LLAILTQFMSAHPTNLYLQSHHVALPSKHHTCECPIILKCDNWQLKEMSFLGSLQQV